MDKIKNYLKMSGTNVSTDIVSMGKVITKPEEKSFKKINAVNMQVFTLYISK